MFPCIMHDPIPLTVPGKCERASLICTTRLFLALASPSALPHRPVALSLSHLRRGVKGWQAEVSWHTSFSADKYLSTGWEKHMRTFLSRTNYSCIFFCSSSFLAPVEMRRWKQLFLPLQLLARAWRTLQSQLYNFPTRITTCVSVNGATQGSASDRFATPLHFATRGRRGSH